MWMPPDSAERIINRKTIMKHSWNKKTTRAGHGRDGGCNLYHGGTYGIHYQIPNRPDIDTSCHGEIRLHTELDFYVLEFFSVADITNDDALQYLDVEVKREEDGELVFKGRIHKTADVGGEWEIETDTLGFAPTFNNTKIRQKE